MGGARLSAEVSATTNDSQPLRQRRRQRLPQFCNVSQFRIGRCKIPGTYQSRGDPGGGPDAPLATRVPRIKRKAGTRNECGFGISEKRLASGGKVRYDNVMKAQR